MSFVTRCLPDPSHRGSRFHISHFPVAFGEMAVEITHQEALLVFVLKILKEKKEKKTFNSSEH